MLERIINGGRSLAEARRERKAKVSVWMQSEAAVEFILNSPEDTIFFNAGPAPEAMKPEEYRDRVGEETERTFATIYSLPDMVIYDRHASELATENLKQRAIDCVGVVFSRIAATV